ncbi:MAG: TonB-dependent receptor [Bryobacterales bacterium]|nr:TonB-dependent receptor [Bryobacterales bacterium]
MIDPDGNPVAGASITLQTASGFSLARTQSDDEGKFRLSDTSVQVAARLTVRAPGFSVTERILQSATQTGDLRLIQLQVAPLPQSITVTAIRGQLVEAADAAAVVSVVELQDEKRGPLPTIGNALEGQTGILVQQTTAGHVSPFLRGLTGYQVLNLVDGIRFNNSTFRSGPNQYLAFIEPSQAETIEAMLGPSSTQYGSDSMGGAINVLSRRARFAADPGWEWHGDAQAMGASADASGYLSGQVSAGSARQSVLAGGAARKLNDLRAGRGEDSRNVYTRFFGMDASQVRDLVGNRLQDSGFQQFGFHSRYAARLSDQQDVSFWYQRGEMQNVRGYKDLLGGRGRMIQEFAPQVLDFLYGRYEKRRLGFLDAITGTVSLNRQQDGSRVQTLRDTGNITEDESAVRMMGYAGQATTHVGSRHTIVFGGEFYDEAIESARINRNPITGTGSVARGLYPNGSTYRTTGLFAQDRVELWRDRLSILGGVRFTRIGVHTFANRNLAPNGQSLGVADSSEIFRDVTWNASVTLRATSWLRFHALAGRGVRAPNMIHLGALGLNDLGYEIPISQALSAGALLSTSGADSALSQGRNAEALRAESVQNYETGLQLGGGKWVARVQAFLSELDDPIVRRTLLFPTASVPAALAGVPVSANTPTPTQAAQGVVTVSTPFDPQAVKAFVNDGASRYNGFESSFAARLHPRWRFDANYSFIAGRDLNPNRNIRRLPPQMARIALLYVPTGRRPWLQVVGRMAGAQRLLSGGDLDDERIGASRRRIDIADFFRGSRNASLLTAGPDGLPGTGDDVFAPTGETLLQIQNRVLPIGATIYGVTVLNDSTRVPLYLTTQGWFALDVQGGMPLSERWQLTFGVQNLFDRNYRHHGSGVDMPGVNGYAGLRFTW